jgi:cytochrome d ubiquinol oxidase subunit II
LDANGFFFLPLWTDLQPGADAGIVDWYTLLVGGASFVALALHGCYWVVLKTSGGLQQRARSFGERIWWAVVAFTAAITFFSFRLQPNLNAQFQAHPWGYLFPALGTAGLTGMKVLSGRRRDLGAFLSSCLYLVGMLTSATFGVFPYVLPSNVNPEAGLTVANASAAHYGLYVGLAWWIPGMLLAAAYSVFVYRHFAGKVSEAA